MNCTISGALASDPCVTPSGHVYSKKALLTYLTTSNNCDPITNAPLSTDSIIDILPAGNSSSAAAPTPPTITSIPSLLSHMQSEWDSLMVSQYELRRQLHETRQELSQALYQNDAAVRVIARLTMERDQARSMVGGGASTEVEPSSAPSAANGGAANSNNSDNKNESDENAMTDEISSPSIPSSALTEMSATWDVLSKGRKKRQLPPDLATSSTIGAYAETSSKSYHKTSGKTGIKSMVVKGDDILTVGADKQVIVYNTKSEEVVGTASLAKGLAGKKEVTCADMLLRVVDGEGEGGRDGERRILAGGSDGTIRLLDCSFKEVDKAVVCTSSVVGVHFHFCGSYFLAACSGGSLVFGNLSSLSTFVTLPDTPGTVYSSSALHPDGLIYACGTDDGDLKVWDLKSSSVATTLSTGQKGDKIVSITFSENGYTLAAGAESGMVTMFDLRKQKATGVANEGGKAFGNSAKGLSFDCSGKLLAYACCDGVGVSTVKPFEEVAKFIGHKKEITGVGFGPSNKQIITASMDKTVKFFGAN